MRTIQRDIVSALIISRDKKLLMGMKASDGGGVYSDCWHIPGGGIDDDEDMLIALKREVLEETGIDISDAEIFLADDEGRGEAEKTLNETGEKVLCAMKFNVYKVILNADSETVAIQTNDDLEKLAWINLDELNDYQITPPSITLFKRLGYLPAID